MASGLSQEVESMRREQRRYKQLQRRATGSMSVYSVTVDPFEVPSGGAVTVWIDGVNTKTLIANCWSIYFLTTPPLIQPIYDPTNDRCGFKFSSPSISVLWYAFVDANQEFTVDVES